MKSWDPKWGELKPVDPVEAPPLPSVRITHEEMQRRRKQYIDSHLKPVLEKREKEGG